MISLTLELIYFFTYQLFIKVFLMQIAIWGTFYKDSLNPVSDKKIVHCTLFYNHPDNSKIRLFWINLFRPLKIQKFQWSGKLGGLCVAVFLGGYACVYLWHFCRLGTHQVKMRPRCPYDFLSYCTLKTTVHMFWDLQFPGDFPQKRFDVVQYTWSTITTEIWRKFRKWKGLFWTLEMQGLLFGHDEEKINLSF